MSTRIINRLVSRLKAELTFDDVCIVYPLNIEHSKELNVNLVEDLNNSFNEMDSKLISMPDLDTSIFFSIKLEKLRDGE